MKPKLLRLWVEFVKGVATLSTCERTQVGCLLLSLNGERLLSFGYNGGTRGGPNHPALDVPGNDFWIHAEANALVKPRPQEPFIALLTHTPCYYCAGLLINSGCQQVYAMSFYRDDRGWQRLREHTLGLMLNEEDYR